jgi:hypothetical protein
VKKAARLIKTAKFADPAELVSAVKEALGDTVSAPSLLHH